MIFVKFCVAKPASRHATGDKRGKSRGDVLTIEFGFLSLLPHVHVTKVTWIRRIWSESVQFCVTILCVPNVGLLGFCGLILLATKGRDKTDDELTAFGTKDIRNTSFNHAVQIQRHFMYFIFYRDWDVGHGDSSRQTVLSMNFYFNQDKELVKAVLTFCC